MPASCQGDKLDQYCDDIDSRECYKDQVRDNCCQTCDDYLVRPVVSGCEYGDRIEQCDVDDGIRCYNSNVTRDCCYTCQGYETSISGCKYGDKVKNCIGAECYFYSQQRLDNCCSTCNYDNFSQSTTWSPMSSSTSTEKATSMTKSGSSGVPSWTVPVAAGVGGVLVLIIVILVVIMCRRKKKPQNLSPIDEQMYKEYKLTKRPPIAPPRHPSTEKGWINEKEVEPEAEYAYINPINVEGPNTDTGGNRRTGTDPLPPTPGDTQLTPAPGVYLDLTGAVLANAYGTAPADDIAHYGQNHERAPSNKYEKFPAEGDNHIKQGDIEDASIKL